MTRRLHIRRLRCCRLQHGRGRSDASRQSLHCQLCWLVRRFPLVRAVVAVEAAVAAVAAVRPGVQRVLLGVRPVALQERRVVRPVLQLVPPGMPQALQGMRQEARLAA